MTQDQIINILEQAGEWLYDYDDYDCDYYHDYTNIVTRSNMCRRILVCLALAHNIPIECDDDYIFSFKNVSTLYDGDFYYRQLGEYLLKKYHWYQYDDYIWQGEGFKYNSIEYSNQYIPETLLDLCKDYLTDYEDEYDYMHFFSEIAIYGYYNPKLDIVHQIASSTKNIKCLEEYTCISTLAEKMLYIFQGDCFIQDIKQEKEHYVYISGYFYPVPDGWSYALPIEYEKMFSPITLFILKELDAKIDKFIAYWK